MKGLKLSSANVLLVISLMTVFRAITEIIGLQHSFVVIGSAFVAVIISLLILKAPTISPSRAAQFARIIAIGCTLNIIAMIHVPVYAAIFTALGMLSGLAASWLIQSAHQAQIDN